MRIFIISFLLVGLFACQASPAPDFWAQMRTLCEGGPYTGHVVSDDPEDDDWRAQDLVVGFETCSDEEIRMPLAVGEDRSRTWVLTRSGDTDGRPALFHEHVLADGSPDPITRYGGEASPSGGGLREEFPADEATRALFAQQGIPQSSNNIWALEIEPDEGMLAYEMRRPGRFFRAEFDLGADAR